MRTRATLLMMMFLAAAAVSAEAGDGALSLTPAVVSLRGVRGQSTTQQLRLTNGASRDFTFDLVALDVVTRDGVRVFVPAGELPGSIAATAVFTPATITVRAGETVAAAVTLTIPPSTAVRGVVAEFHGRDRIMRGPVPTTASLGTLLTFTLSDAVAVDAGAMTVAPQTPTSNATFVQPLSNGGSEPLMARGVAAILDRNGALVGRATLRPRRLMPGEKSELRGEYPGELAKGTYRVLMTCQSEAGVVTRDAPLEVR